MQELVRWNIDVSRDTDEVLRMFLHAEGLEAEKLSQFIEEAVRTQVFHRTVESIKARNAATDPEELHLVIDNAVNEVRISRKSA